MNKKIKNLMHHKMVVAVIITLILVILISSSFLYYYDTPEYHYKNHDINKYYFYPDSCFGGFHRIYNNKYNYSINKDNYFKTNVRWGLYYRGAGNAIWSKFNITWHFTKGYLVKDLYFDVYDKKTIEAISCTYNPNIHICFNNYLNSNRTFMIIPENNTGHCTIKLHILALQINSKIKIGFRLDHNMYLEKFHFKTEKHPAIYGCILTKNYFSNTSLNSYMYIKDLNTSKIYKIPIVGGEYIFFANPENYYNLLYLKNNEYVPFKYLKDNEINHPCNATDIKLVNYENSLHLNLIYQ